MSLVSELSVMELNAERAELLPEREALQITVGGGTITQTAANVNSAALSATTAFGGDASVSLSQSIMQAANTGVVVS